jgi:hypothetical protein
MAVTITNEELDIFNKHGIKDTDIKATVENYRSQGLDDTAIRAKVQAKLDSWTTPKVADKPNSIQSDKDPKVAEIIAKGEADRKAIEQENKKANSRMALGATMQGASLLPIPLLKTPFLGSALSGALYDAGGAIVEGQSGLDIAKRAARGAAAGATIEGAIKAIPFVGKPLAKSNVGKTVINKTNELTKPLTDKASQIIKPVLENETVKKIGQELTKERTLPQIIKKAEKPLPKATPVAEKIAENVTAPKAEEVTIAPAETKSRGLEQSVLNAKGTPDEIKDIIQKDAPTYNVLKNEDIINKAVGDVEKNFQGELSRLMGAEEFDALDYEKSRQIAKRLFDAGEHEAGMELIDRVSENATKKGQAIQALSLWSNMTPEGAVFKAQKLLKEYNKKNPKKEISLTAEQTENIRKLQNEALMATDELSKNQGFARTAKYISELVPKNAMQKLKTFRNLSLLLNPKTLGRNIVGNTLFNTVDTVSKTLAVPIDAAMGLVTGKRTRVLPQIGAGAKGLVKGAVTGAKEAIEGIDTRGLGQRFDLTQGRVFESKPMRALETALDIGLRVPDRAFYEATFAESVANMMKAQGLKQPTQEILEQAEKEALESVFQNRGYLSNKALALRELLNAEKGNYKGFGAGDALIPYAQTPANIAQQGINYSPLGGIKGAVNFAKGDQRQASLDVARALTGTGLIGGGYGLSKVGKITPSQFDENAQTNKRIKENYLPLGVRPDQLNGVWYSPFQPISTPLAVGGAMARGENPYIAGLNTLIDLPFLQGISRGFRNLQEGELDQAIANTLSQVPSQFVPTLGSQVAQYIDPYQRETYSPNVWQRGLNQAVAKIPLASQTLPIKYDVTGQPIERYNSEGLQRAFDVFLNPTFVNQPKENAVLNEVTGLYTNTGETKQLLPSVQKKLNYTDSNGEKQKKELTGKEVSKYQKVLGQMNALSIEDLMQTPYYQGLSEDEKIKEINARMDYNNQLVKNKQFDIPIREQKKPNKVESKVQSIKNDIKSVRNKQYKQEANMLYEKIVGGN